MILLRYRPTSIFVCSLYIDAYLYKIMGRPKLGIKEVDEEEVCPECFKVVGSQSRYKIVCYLGKQDRIKEGASVKELTEQLRLQQPTVTHHLNILKSISAVTVKDRGRERIYFLNPDAHCFEECNIPY